MRNPLRLSMLLGLLVALSVPTLAHAEDWVIDTAHTNLGFKVRHMMVSWVRGSFHGVSGSISMKGQDAKTLKVDVTIDASTIDTDKAKRDKHLRSPDFFDVQNFPTLTFKSTSVVPHSGDPGFDLVGDLTIRGVTKRVTLEAEGFTPPIKDPWGGTKIGTSAEATIHRKDFGLVWNQALEAGGVLVGDDVHIILDLEMGLKR